MIQNKKLFVIAIIAGFLVCLGVDMPALLLGWVRNDLFVSSLFFIGNALVGVLIYTLIYHSLKKTPVLKNIYRLVLLIGSFVLIVGIIILVISL